MLYSYLRSPTKAHIYQWLKEISPVTREKWLATCILNWQIRCPICR